LVIKDRRHLFVTPLSELNCWLGAAGIEILFGRIFKANIQIEGFYSLLRSEEGLKLNTEVSAKDQLVGLPSFGKNPRFTCNCDRQKNRKVYIFCNKLRYSDQTYGTILYGFSHGYKFTA
jgi:hypothetical protein